LSENKEESKKKKTKKYTMYESAEVKED